MKKINFIASIIIIVVILFFAFFKVLLIRINIGEVGVRLQQYGFLGKKGVQKNDFGPGWHRRIPGLDTWEVFDATVQTTEFTSEQDRKRLANWRESLFRSSAPSEYSSVPYTGPERIELKSKDGYTVKLDVTVKYRIKPDSAWKLFQDVGPGERYKGLVRDQSQQALRTVFGNLRTEEFYKPDIRRIAQEEATESLTRELDRINVELISILVRDISFAEAYERKILDKKLADQDVELNKSRAIREEKRGETNKIAAETEAKVMVIAQEQESELVKMKAETEKQIASIRAEADLKVARIRADADLYAAEKIAAGDLLEKEATAKGEQLKAQALQGSGGKNLVAREAVSGLMLDSVTLSTVEINFLDVEKMVERLGATD
ncbi:MAG: SPFH domain-containing protein [Candidatus Sumerlaeia bacterium]